MIALNANQILELAKGPKVIRWDQRAVKEAVQVREQLVPALLNHMDWIYEQFQKPMWKPDKASVALCRNGCRLLGEMQETCAYPVLLKILTLSGWKLDRIFGEDLTERMKYVLANTYDGNLAETERLAADTGADEYARGAVVNAMGILCQRGRLPREELVRFLREVLHKELELDNGGFLIGVVETVGPLHLHEVCREMRDLMVSETCDALLWPEIMDKLFQYDGVQGEAWVPEDTQHDIPDGPTPQERRILEYRAGRNEPCPCGSGKKFKTCCLRKQEELRYQYPSFEDQERYTEPYDLPPIIYPPIESVEGHPGLAAYFPRDGIAVDEHAYRAIEIGGGVEYCFFESDELQRIATEELWAAFEGFRKICEAQGYHTPEEYDCTYGVHYSSSTWLNILAGILEEVEDSRLEAVQQWLSEEDE